MKSSGLHKVLFIQSLLPENWLGRIFPTGVRSDSPSRGDPFVPSTLNNRPFRCLAVEVGLDRNHGVHQVHCPRRTSNFYLVDPVGCRTRMQAMMWRKVKWCVLARASALQHILYQRDKHQIYQSWKVVRSLTRKGRLSLGGRRYEMHVPGG